jgi:hypothetical protein
MKGGNTSQKLLFEGCASGDGGLNSEHFKFSIDFTKKTHIFMQKHAKISIPRIKFFLLAHKLILLKSSVFVLLYA